jgi:pimeloyl-ACP methyl ester carboxylesterase
MGEIATVLLVHGGCGTTAVWDKVVPLLEKAGIPTRTMQLPSCTADEPLDDAAGLRAMLDEMSPPVVVVGHSYGGMVLTEAGDHLAVRHLIYMDAVVPGVGESILDLLGTGINPAFGSCLRARDDGTMMFDLDELAAYFASTGWDPDEVQEALPGLTPQRLSHSVVAPTTAAWRTVPSTFISCTESELSAETRARFGARATHVIEIPGDHFPNWRRPEEVAEIFARIATEVGAGESARA